MKVSWLLITTGVALLVNPTAIAQECVNCWVNPTTGKLETFWETPQPSQSNSVMVYGTQSCGWTKRMMSQLAQRKIPYQFKDINSNSNQVEMWDLLRNAGVSRRSIPLPMVYIKGEVMLRPTIENVMARLR